MFKWYVLYVVLSSFIGIRPFFIGIRGQRYRKYMKTRNKFQLFWLNRSNSWFKSKKRLFLVLHYWFSVQSESLPPGAPVDSQSESLPPGALADSQSESLPSGVLADSQSESLPLGALADYQSESLPPGALADSQSAVKKCSTTFPLGICNPHPLYLYFILKQPARRSGWFSIRKSSARRSSGFAIRCQKMFDHFPPGDLQSPSSLFVFHSPARRSGWFSIRKSPVRRSSGFAIRCQKMFDHFPLGICNPHPLYLYFILKQSQERL